MKRKETFKNISLVVLILISIGLFSNMWFSEKLWSDGYDFFAFFNVFSDKNDESGSAFAISDIVAPRRFVISGGDKRSIVTNSDSDYSRCVSETYSLFAGTISDFSSATYDEWKSGLKSKSILVDFGVPVSAMLLSKIGITAPENGMFTKILIVPEKSVSKQCAIYFENSFSGEISKCTADNRPTVSTLISNLSEGSGAMNIPYAFELGFDSVKLGENEEINQNILLDSTISLGLSNRQIYSAEIKNAVSTQNTGRILKNFFDTGVSVRRYVEKDGSSVFVNRKSTLKISPGGYIEYTAEGEGKKFASGDNSVAESLSSVMSLVRSISAQCNISGVKFQLHHSPGYTSPNEITVSLDYLIGSVPLCVADGNGDVVPAVTAKIKDGRLVYFKFYVCNISVLPQQTVLPPMLKAIDNLYSQAGGEKLDVSDLYVSYIADDVSHSAKPSWCARVKNSDRVIIINGE